MASPYDAAIDMFDLPRYQGLQGSFTFPRREAPQDMARRSFLEGPSMASPEDEEWSIASQSPDPIGVMDELRKVREERETQDLIGAIAELDPAAKDYLQRVRGTIGQNPKALSNPAVGRILDFQSRFMPPKRPAPAFQYPQFQSQYQKLVAGGADPQAAADEVQMAEQQYGLQRQLAASGLPYDVPEMMTDGRLDELKVLQTLAKAKEQAREKIASIRVPTELNEALADAVTRKDPEAIAEASDAIARYQSEFARFIPQKPSAQQPQAAPTDLKRVDAPIAAPQSQPVPQAPQTNIPVTEEEVSETVTESVVPRRTEQPVKVGKVVVPDSKWKEFDVLEEIRQGNLDWPQNELTPEVMASISEDSKKFNAKKKEIMDMLGLPDTPKGMEVFDAVVRARSRTDTISAPGVTATGTSWKVTPKATS